MMGTGSGITITCSFMWHFSSLSGPRVWIWNWQLVLKSLCCVASERSLPPKKEPLWDTFTFVTWSLSIFYLTQCWFLFYFRWWYKLKCLNCCSTGNGRLKRITLFPLESFSSKFDWLRWATQRVHRIIAVQFSGLLSLLL